MYRRRVCVPRPELCQCHIQWAQPATSWRMPDERWVQYIYDPPAPSSRVEVYFSVLVYSNTAWQTTTSLLAIFVLAAATCLSNLLACCLTVAQQPWLMKRTQQPPPASQPATVVMRIFSYIEHVWFLVLIIQQGHWHQLYELVQEFFDMCCKVDCSDTTLLLYLSPLLLLATHACLSLLLRHNLMFLFECLGLCIFGL